MEMRYMKGAEALLGDLVMRTLQNTGTFDIASLREEGFRALERGIFDPQFRALAPLPDNSQKLIDDAVTRVGMDRLTVVQDVLSDGLTYNLPNALSYTQLEWNNSNKVGNAFRTMTPKERGENFIPDMLPGRLPIYLTLSKFEIDIRELRMSQRLGRPLDTAQIEWGTRAVNESLEDALINGATTIDGQDLKVAGYGAPGLLNAPNAETQTLTATAWDTTPVAATVLAETQAMLAKLRANKKYGPYRMYVNTDIGANLDNDYVTASPQNTIRERLLKLEGLKSIKTADLIPAGTAVTGVGAKVVIVQMTSDVLDIVDGQRPTVIPWTSADGFTFHNMVMAIMIPRVRSDYNSKSGIVVGTLA